MEVLTALQSVFQQLQHIIDEGFPSLRTKEIPTCITQNFPSKQLLHYTELTNTECWLCVVNGGKQDLDNRKTQLMRTIFYQNYHHTCKQNRNLHTLLNRNICIHLVKHLIKNTIHSLLKSLYHKYTIFVWFSCWPTLFLFLCAFAERW